MKARHFNSVSSKCDWQHETRAPQWKCLWAMLIYETHKQLISKIYDCDTTEAWWRRKTGC